MTGIQPLKPGAGQTLSLRFPCPLRWPCCAVFRRRGRFVRLGPSRVRGEEAIRADLGLALGKCKSKPEPAQAAPVRSLRQGLWRRDADSSFPICLTNLASAGPIRAAPPPAPQNAQPLVVKIDNPLCRPKKICGLKNRSMPTTPGVRQPRASEGADDGLDELGAPFCAGRLRKLKEAKASRAKPAACAQAGPTLGSSLLPQKTAPLIGSGSSSKTARPKRGRPASGASSGSAESPHRSMEGPIRRASRFAPWDIGAG